jgi:hypothetical protein
LDRVLLGTLRVNPQVVTQATPDGAVLMDMATSECFELNAVGAEIWTRLGRGESAPAIIQALGTSYPTPAGTIEADVQALLAELVQRRLLFWSPP